MKHRKDRLCYLCGKPGADSKDHVPPRCIFPKKPKGNLITVPAHEKCNNAFTGDDELLRNVVIAGSYRTASGRQAWDEQVVSSFKKNPKARDDILRRLIPVSVKDPATGSTSERQGIFIELSLYERQVKRIVRGLFYNRFKTPLPQDWPIEFQKMPPPEQSLPELIAGLAQRGFRLEWNHVEPGVFSYTFTVWDRDRRVCFAILVFFDTEVFCALVGRE